MKTWVKFVFILAVAALASRVSADDASPRITGTVRDPQNPITIEERAEIETVIMKETTGEIESIHRVSSDTFTVTTVWDSGGRFRGQGKEFTLKRAKAGWEILKKGHWID